MFYLLKHFYSLFLLFVWAVSQDNLDFMCKSSALSYHTKGYSDISELHAIQCNLVCYESFYETRNINFI